MLLSLWNVAPMLTFVGVADQSVRQPRGRLDKIAIVAADERPPPN